MPTSQSRMESPCRLWLLLRHHKHTLNQSRCVCSQIVLFTHYTVSDLYPSSACRQANQWSDSKSCKSFKGYCRFYCNRSIQLNNSLAETWSSFKSSDKGPFSISQCFPDNVYSGFNLTSFQRPTQSAMVGLLISWMHHSLCLLLFLSGKPCCVIEADRRPFTYESTAVEFDAQVCLSMA